MKEAEIPMGKTLDQIAEEVIDLEKQFDITWTYVASGLYELVTPLSEARAPIALPIMEAREELEGYFVVLGEIVQDFEKAKKDFDELLVKLEAPGAFPDLNSQLYKIESDIESQKTYTEFFKEVLKKIVMLEDQDQLSAPAAEEFVEIRKQLEKLHLPQEGKDD